MRRIRRAAAFLAADLRRLRRPRGPVRTVPPLLLLVLLAAAPTTDQVQDAERAKAADVAAQQAAQAAARDAVTQEQQLTKLRLDTARTLQAAEQALAQASAQIADLTQRHADAEARLAARAADLAPVLPVLERLSLYPAETLLAVPMPPEQAIRGMLVLGGIARSVEQAAAAVRAEQAEVARLREQIDAALPALAQAQAAQAQLAVTLDAQIATARAAHAIADDDAATAARRAAADAARADSLRGAIARLDADRKAADAKARAVPAPPIAASVGSSGTMTAPVAGAVARAFGAPTEAGPASGTSFQAPPRARVLSPCGGHVVFAGPFRSFGLLAIVDCGAGTHVVLSGLDRLDAALGQTVQAGEPLGVMPAWDPAASGSVRPTLYLEVRKDGVAVNPAAFLRSRS